MLRGSWVLSGHIFLPLLILFLVSPPDAQGDRESNPYDYKQITSNRKYIFVMLAPEERFPKKDGYLRLKYSKSGLYRNHLTAVPLWTVDWYDDKVYVSSDGKHLVRMEGWPRLNDGLVTDPVDAKQFALAFYDSGKLLKRYSIGDLVGNPAALPRSISHFNWRNDISFDDTLGQLKMTTLEGKRYVFDIRSGEIINQ